MWQKKKTLGESSYLEGIQQEYCMDRMMVNLKKNT